MYGINLEPYPLTLTMHHATIPNATEQVQIFPINMFEMMATLYAGNRFPLSMIGEDGPGAIDAYWENLSESTDHHVTTDPKLRPFRALTFPLYIHFDGGDIFKRTEFMIASFSSALVSGINSLDCQLLMMVVDCSRMVKNVTYKEIVIWIRWAR